jgi:hypothetical protein
MLAATVQHKRAEWISLNVLAFLLVTSLATVIATAISWPRPRASVHASRRRKSWTASGPTRSS